MNESVHDLSALESAALAAEARVAELTADYARQSAEMAAALANIQVELATQEAAAKKARGNWHLANIYRLIGD